MRALFAFLVVTAACADVADVEVDEVEVPAEDDGKSDSASELRVRTGETSVWMRRDLVRKDDVFVLRGRASRNVTDGSGFVFDDPYGDFAARTARTFEVSWPASTLRSLADGVNQFVRIHFTPSAGRPDSLTARVVVRPRLVSFSGSSSIYLTAELAPVVVDGLVVYRLRGKTSSAFTALEIHANGRPATAVRKTAPDRFELDLEPDVAIAIAGSSHPDANVYIALELADGQVVAKQAKLGFAIKKLGLTAGDAYELWPPPRCTTELRSCLQALPDGAVDLASCGEAVVVQACAGQVGVVVDEVAMQASIADGASKTAAATFLADATGLVGAARRDAFAFGAQQTLEYRLEQHFGRWYLSTTARAAALRRAVDGGIDYAFAHPLDLVEPIAPQPGDPAVTRQVAADALLRELEVYDFPASEYARTYDQLVAQFRTKHVTSIRAFRETLAIEPHPGMPGRDVIVGNWLDPYVEVAIDRATGEATSVYIEID